MGAGNTRSKRILEERKRKVEEKGGRQRKIIRERDDRDEREREMTDWRFRSVWPGKADGNGVRK